MAFHAHSVIATRLEPCPRRHPSRALRCLKRNYSRSTIACALVQRIPGALRTALVRHPPAISGRRCLRLQRRPSAATCGLRKLPADAEGSALVRCGIYRNDSTSISRLNRARCTMHPRVSESIIRSCGRRSCGRAWLKTPLPAQKYSGSYSA